jgi:hypothetical protein
MKRILLSIALFAVFSVPAMAWPSCSGNWVQVPAGTSANNGTIYVTGDRITFQCQPKTTPPPPSNDGNNSSKSTSSSNANAGAVSGSTSSAIGKGGSVKNSGNSSNTNTNTATGGNAVQGQKQGQGQSQLANSSATNSGNNSSYSNATNIAAARIPVATAYAPEAQATVTCFKGFGAGVQTPLVGGSFGGGKIDKNCAILETARSFGISGSRLSYCKTMLLDDVARKAGVTLEDCMTVPAPPVVVVPPVVEPLPVAVTLQPLELTPISTTVSVRDLGTCKLHRWNTCSRILDDAVLLLRANTNSSLNLVGPQESSKAMTYLRGKVDPSRVTLTFADDQNSTLSISLFTTEGL